MYVRHVLSLRFIKYIADKIHILSLVSLFFIMAKNILNYNRKFGIEKNLFS